MFFSRGVFSHTFLLPTPSVNLQQKQKKSMDPVCTYFALNSACQMPSWNLWCWNQAGEFKTPTDRRPHLLLSKSRFKDDIHNILKRQASELKNVVLLGTKICGPSKDTSFITQWFCPAFIFLFTTPKVIINCLSFSCRS